MEALKLFYQNAPRMTFFTVLFGSLSGLFYALLIPLVLHALNARAEPGALLEFGGAMAWVNYGLLFFVLCGLILVFSSISEIFLARIAIDIRFNLRKKLYGRISGAKMPALEQVGSSKLLQALSSDVTAIVTGAQLFPPIVTNTVTLVGMLGYLAWLNLGIFAYVLVIIVLGVVTYQIPVYFGTRYFARAREHQNDLQEAFKGLVEGANELRLCTEKQRFYQDEVLFVEEENIKHEEKKGQTIYCFTSNYGKLLSFFAIGGLSFVFARYSALSSADIIAAVMVLLYVSGPLGGLLNAIPYLAHTKIALDKIDQLYSQMPSEPLPTDPANGQANEKAQRVPTDWKKLRLHNIQYQHMANGSHTKPFAIGPISFDIHRGEITFIAGGNGSGKSTLAKVISQHYQPSHGAVYLDDCEVTSENLRVVRKQVSCIYSDYYLFDRLLSLDEVGESMQQKVNHYLEVFGLNDKVTIENGHFSTLKLSDGQRRRLALIVAIVEDKSLLVFDEWAADQDPQFKQVFYQDILPTLKSKNKAVVVISHDDRYFDLADRILVMESGKKITN